MNLLLVCANGLSTSLLAQKMEKELENEDIRGKVSAIDIDSVKSYLEENAVDCLLLAPQVHYAQEEVKVIVDQKKIPLVEISSMSYGRLNAKKILEDVKKRIGDKFNG